MMRFLGRVLWIGVLAGAAVGLATPAQAQTTLRYKFKEGDKYGYVMDQNMDMKMNIAGTDIAMTVKQTIDMSWKVISVDSEGKAKVGQTIDRIRFIMDGGPLAGGKTEFDSKDGKEPEGPVGKAVTPILKAMVGAEFTMTMNARGEPSDVKVPQKVIDALKNAGGGAGGAPGADMFSEDNLKQMLGQNGLVLPKDPVKKGESWNQKTEMKMAPIGKMSVDSKYTYEGDTTRGGQKLEQIGVKPNLTLEPTPGAPAEVKLKSQEAKGTTYFDNDKGRLVESDLKQNMDMEIGAGGQTFAMKIAQTMNMKLVPAK